ncbi:MAG: hypothetical protein KJ666_17290 [Bacteroidetes bacterium]|nr:hypothetical protein [Bacteroidota bacterium]MBU2583911.1 hypothetical protein [Bacteroidota bacterium]
MSRFLLLIFLSIYSCKEQSVPPDNRNVQPDIVSFVRNQELPKQQDIFTFIEVKNEQFVGFKVSYGEGHDCRSGCFYSLAYGIVYKQKIGWFRINDYDGNDLSSKKYYEIENSDSYLFVQSLWDTLNSVDSWFYRYAFLPRIARDVDSPVDVLRRIAEGLYTYIQPSLAFDLMDNTIVKTNKEILTILSNLPVFQGDAYYEAREKAKQLLQLLLG